MEIYLMKIQEVQGQIYSPQNHKELQDLPVLLFLSCGPRCGSSTLFMSIFHSMRKKGEIRETNLIKGHFLQDKQVFISHCLDFNQIIPPNYKGGQPSVSGWTCDKLTLRMGKLYFTERREEQIRHNSVFTIGIACIFRKHSKYIKAKIIYKGM